MALGIELKGLRVRSLDRDMLEVSWSLTNTDEDVLNYTFQVLRSESPAGPFTPLSEPFSDKYLLVDNAVASGHRWRKYYYLVRVTHRVTGASEDYGPASQDADPDLIAAELRRHMALLMREFAGRRCWVLPVRTFGQRCSCWNERLRQKRRSGCLLCFDTGFVRGYLSPIETWMQIDPSPKSQQNTPLGPQQQSNTTARLPYYPPLKPNDLVVEGENRRWRVVSVSQTEKARAVIHQEVQLHEIPPKDIEFAIPLTLETALRDLWLSPSRNYTNPHNTEAFSSFLDAEMPGIFSLYALPKSA